MNRKLLQQKKKTKRKLKVKPYVKRSMRTHSHAQMSGPMLRFKHIWYRITHKSNISINNAETAATQQSTEVSSEQFAVV